MDLSPFLIVAPKQGALRFSLSSFGAYRLADLGLLPTISQHRFPCGSSCFLYLVREPSSLYVDKQGALRFSYLFKYALIMKKLISSGKSSLIGVSRSVPASVTAAAISASY